MDWASMGQGPLLSGAWCLWLLMGASVLCSVVVASALIAWDTADAGTVVFGLERGSHNLSGRKKCIVQSLRHM